MYSDMIDYGCFMYSIGVKSALGRPVCFAAVLLLTPRLLDDREMRCQKYVTGLNLG